MKSWRISYGLFVRNPADLDETMGGGRMGTTQTTWGLRKLLGDYANSRLTWGLRKLPTWGLRKLLKGISI